MLSEKPWKAEAVLRLLLGVFLCIYAGSLLALALYHRPFGPGAALRFYGLVLAAIGFIGVTLFLLRHEWKLEDVLRRLVLALAAFYAAFLLGLWAQKVGGPDSVSPSVAQMVISALSFQGAALLLVQRFLWEHHIQWRAAFGLQNNWRQAVLLGLIAACLFLPFGWGLQLGIATGLEWAANRLPGLHLKPEEQQAVHTLQMAVTMGSRVALGLITIVLAPVAEETLFRGILYPWIKRAGFPRLALWGTALLFAAVHMNLVSFVPLSLLALVLTLLYERTGNLLAPITGHALFNGMNFFILYMFQEQWSKMR